MIKPLPEEAVWVCWPKMLVLVAEQLMDTALFTTEAYTVAGSIFVWPSTFFTCTVTGCRSLCWMVVLPLLLPLPAMAAPPQPARPPVTAQARISAVTFTAARWKKPCFFGCTGGCTGTRLGSGA